MRRIRLLLMFLICGELLFAQQNAGIRQAIENELSQRSYSSDYTSFFRFEEQPNPSRFTYIQASGSVYERFEIMLQNILAADIVAEGEVVNLTLTLRDPIDVFLLQDMFGKVLRKEERYMLSIPRQDYGAALRLRRMFQDVNKILYHRIQGQLLRVLPDMVCVKQVHGSFLIGKYPVTVQQYRSYCTDIGRPMPSPPPWGWRSDHPMVQVSSEEARAYTTWLSEISGETYVLPTLKIWKRTAAKGGDSNDINKIAWWGENARNMTQPVGKMEPNGWGIYDMQGNVWEWVDGSVDDSEVQAAGGSWDSHFEQCQWDSIVMWPIGSRDTNVGFRVMNPCRMQNTQ